MAYGWQFKNTGGVRGKRKRLMGEMERRKW